MSTHTVSQLAVAHAKARGIDTSRAAKDVRRMLRDNFAVIIALDPSVSKVKENANDGNRWPAMNDDVRTFVLDRTKRDGLKAKAAQSAKRSRTRTKTAK